MPSQHLQSDPFGPFLFALAIHDVITEIGAAHPDVVLMAFLDYIFFLGDASAVAAAFRALRVGLAGVNLKVNIDKCKAYAPEADTDVSPLTTGFDPDDEHSAPLGLPIMDGGCIVLGVPVGATAASKLVDAVAFLDPVDKFPRALAKKLVGIDNLVKHGKHYTALLLLTMCAAPTVNNLLRAQPPRVTLPASREADELLRSAFLRTLDIAISEVPAGSFRERLVHLRVKSGGLGIQSAVDTAGRAFFASWAACGAAIASRCPHLAADIAAIFPAPPPGAAPPLPGGAAGPAALPAPPLTLAFQRDLLDQRSTLETDLALDLSEITLAEPKYGEQRRLGELAAEHTRTVLADAVKAAARGQPDEEQTLAWWHCTAELGRGAYLQRFALWKPLSLCPLAMVVRRHLRLPLPELRDCKRCACGAAVTPHGDHADCCRLLSALRTYRHNELRDAGVLAPLVQTGGPASVPRGATHRG